MATIAGMSKKIKDLKLREAVPEMIKETSADIILLNQLQLLHGLDSMGEPIRPEYAFGRNDYYARKKNARNPLPGFGVPDLRDTGEFYQDFTLEVTDKEFTLNSNNNKTADLLSKYGPFIFGLSKDNLEIYTLETFRPKFQNYITKKTGLEFR